VITARKNCGTGGTADCAAAVEVLKDDGAGAVDPGIDIRGEGGTVIVGQVGPSDVIDEEEEERGEGWRDEGRGRRRGSGEEIG